MGDQVSITRLIKHLEARKIKLAVDVTENGKDYEGYLIGAGRVRECRSLIQLLQTYSEKTPRPEPARVRALDNEPEDLDPNEEDDDPDDEDEDEEPTPPPRSARPARSPKPRGWGS